MDAACCTCAACVDQETSSDGLQVVVGSILDVFGSNKRLVVRMEADGGFVLMLVIVAAAEVGSIRMVVSPDERVEKGAALGHFAYGGSSVVALFPSKRVRFDEDLVKYSQQGIETLVRTGASLGVC
jgi:phosphatidylserine decarboxylase